MSSSYTNAVNYSWAGGLSVFVRSRVFFALFSCFLVSYFFLFLLYTLWFGVLFLFVGFFFIVLKTKTSKSYKQIAVENYHVLDILCELNI